MRSIDNISFSKCSFSKCSFSKYSGAGNDFVVVDNRNENFPLDRVSQLCDRHEGVGADGVLLLQQSNCADYRMRIINADGSEAAQCGNGLRCFMRYLNLEIDGCTQALVETEGGLVRLQVQGDQIAASMPAAEAQGWNLQVNGLELHSLLVGVPHVVHFGQPQNLTQIGRTIRNHPRFAPAGTNVNFAWNSPQGELEIRTYERGVEGLTQACGTGAVATACAASHILDLPSPITLRTIRGDHLRVLFRREKDKFEEIQLIGPARFVFKGCYELTC